MEECSEFVFRLDGRLVRPVGDELGFLMPAGMVSVLSPAFGIPLDLERSLLWVSRCCFMLSARVNFFWQPGQVQLTAFSAVWILE
jgi:hypothetical protein